MNRTFRVETPAYIYTISARYMQVTESGALVVLDNPANPASVSGGEFTVMAFSPDQWQQCLLADGKAIQAIEVRGDPFPDIDPEDHPSIGD